VKKSPGGEFFMLGVHEKIAPFARGDFLTGAKISCDTGVNRHTVMWHAQGKKSLAFKQLDYIIIFLPLSYTFCVNL